MEIVVKGADFSALGFGNTRWVEQYITAIGTTNTTLKTALRSLYTEMSVAGIDKKLEVLRLFVTGNETFDALNLLDVTKYSLGYIGTNPASHTSSGWTPSTSHFGTSSYKAKNLLNFHLHVWNQTIETSANGYFAGLMGVNNATNDIILGVSRGISNGNTIGRLSAYTNYATSELKPASYSYNKTGLLTVARNNDVIKLYDAGVQIDTKTVAFAGTTDGTIGINEGNAFPSANPTFATGAKLMSIAYGASTWTDADELAFKTALLNFKTTLGI